MKAGSFETRNSLRLRVVRGAGFTILELLVAMTILALLVVMLLGIVDNGTKLWRQSESQVDSFREARAALNVIAHDLRVMCSSTNTTGSFYTNMFQTNVDMSGLQTNSSDKIFFLSSENTNAQDAGSRSDLCATGYFVAFGKAEILNSSTPSGFNLYRYFRESNDTYSRLAAGTSIYASIGTAGQAPSECLARNIVDFKIAAMTLTATGDTTPFVQTATTPIPDVIEVKITALNSDLVKRLNSQTDWANTNTLLFQQGMQTFVTRITTKK